MGHSRRRISRVTEIMDLPRAMMVNILSRLPIRPIFQCKTVCKLWYNILYPDPLFVKMHQTRSRRFPCILRLDWMGRPSLLELKASYYYYTRCNRPIPMTPEFHLPPGRLNLVGSCNGIICLVRVFSSDDWTHIYKQSVYICNPLLGEYFEVEVPQWKTSVSHVAYRFCFSEASQQYKVLRLVATEFTASELEVYTLGVGEKWRNVGEIPCPELYNFGKACVNGALHWMDSERNDCIYSFDIETEKINSLPTPPGLETQPPRLMLAELGNYLCLIDSVNMWSDNVYMWWMKEYGVADSWTKDSILVLSFMPGPITRHSFQPILIWKDGEILIESERKLASYNPESKMFIPVNVYGDVIEPIRYIPSFYSLKTIMGDNFQVTNVYPKTKIV